MDHGLKKEAMENILYNISQVLGITVIHSLWQALVVYFMLRVALMFGHKLSSSSKYLMAVSALFTITGWFFYTLITEINVYEWIFIRSDHPSVLPVITGIPAAIHQFNEVTARYYYDIEQYLPYIAILYIAGLLFNTGKLVIARKKLGNIKQTISIDVELQYLVNKFTPIIGISKKVKIGLSNLVDAPCMAGYIKPVILLPFTLTTYMSAHELEAIVLHEMAHIKRNDYLVNLLQQVIAILLFFNPCAILINRIINEERENCCDDLVVKATASPLIYAKALLKLEQTRQNDQKLALAATGKKYHLLNRIERIMKSKQPTTGLRPALLAMLIFTAAIGCITLLKPQIAQGKISVNAISPLINNMLADTGHKSSTNKTAQVHPVKKHHTTAAHKEGDHYAEAENDKKMEELNAGIKKHSEAVSGYFNSGNFKEMQEKMERLSKELQEYYDRPEVKRQQEELAKAGADFSKNWGRDEKEQMMPAQMGEMGRSIGAYFKSPEFKRMDAELRKKYGIPLERNFNDDRDENYKKYEEELDSKLPHEIKEKTEKLKRMGEEIGARYKSPEFMEQNKRMQELGDSVNKAYSNPEIKEKQKEMEKLGAEMSAWQNSAQIKKEQEQLNAAVRKLTAYINSPEYHRYLKQLQNMNFNYNFNYNDDEKSEKAEKAEKIEKTEKAEKVEKPEKPEKPESPDGDN
jgi:beta-lactamase regulating signal transducer with metallopeptidase domain